MVLDRDLYADAARMNDHRRYRREAVDRDVYAEDVTRMNEHQRRRRERPSRRCEGLSPWAALAIAGGAMAVSGLIGRRYSPQPSHPGIERWYRGLDKPSYTPPDPVFGGVWPAL